jgi:hypothetical protein
MRIAHRFAACVVTVLLGISSLPLYVCAESAATPCTPKAAMADCGHESQSPARLTCCCTAKDVPVTPDATTVTGVPTPQPLAVAVADTTVVTVARVSAAEAASQSFRIHDIPTLFSTFLL